MKRYFGVFLCLHLKLEKKFSGQLPDFPPRRPKIFMDAEFLQLRRQGLEAFFCALPDKAFQTEEVKQFFDFYNPDLKKRVCQAFLSHR
jgi:hypothetical protein